MRRDDMIPELRDVAVWPSVNIDVLDAAELARFRTVCSQIETDSFSTGIPHFRHLKFPTFSTNA